MSDPRLWGIEAKQIRQRLDRWMNLRDSMSKDGLLTELWAIMSDMQLWMEDWETKNKDSAAESVKQKA